jgi:signal transduction histidine kinase
MTRQLLPRQWTPDEIHLLSELQKTIIQQDMSIPSIDPVMRSDREEALAAWLKDHGIAQAWDVAPNLAGIGLTPDRLEALANGMSGAALKDILTWVERSVAVEQFIQEVGRTTARISDLVRAVKAYSHVDQVSLRSTNVQEDIENALLMLGYKVRQAAIQIERRYETDLPTIQAYGTELQQVWTNLIDNAVDALESSTPPRRLEVRAATDGEFVNVSLIDNGPGIPTEIQPRIFDPFFTTKAVGKGTGLGLEIVKRIINRHGGTIRVDSKPGETRFEIRLPIRQPTAPPVTAGQ